MAKTSSWLMTKICQVQLRSMVDTGGVGDLLEDTVGVVEELEDTGGVGEMFEWAAGVEP